ncbi:conserved hypothetical protein [Ricinus communis]|uniref:Uncharacterized protein n=1 Tax=Ricinus communis TaxID=3988 RepID=B9RWU8_RICCO|nr:conserved hypothetical protein [Ricinus communis]
MKEVVQNKSSDANLSFLEELDIEEIGNKAQENATKEADGGEHTEAIGGKAVNVNPHLRDGLNVEGDVIEALDIINDES